MAWARRGFNVLAAVLVLAAGVWLRVTSLGTMHFPDADEAWYGAQALELARGGRAATRTTAGNLIDPNGVKGFVLTGDLPRA